MLIINDCKVETVEDILWVFEPDETRLHFEKYDEAPHRAWWHNDRLGYGDVKYVEFAYCDNQKFDFEIWYEIDEDGVSEHSRNNSIEELVGLIWKWHSRYRPTKIFAFATGSTINLPTNKVSI